MYSRAKRVSIRGVPTEKSETFPRMLGKCRWHFPSHAEGNSEVYSFKVKLHLEKDSNFVMGEGRAELLRAIEKYKSLKNAAKALGMSYRYAWDIMKKTEKGVGVRIVSAKHGGKYGGGTELTEDGMKILSMYEERKRLVERYAAFPSPILTVDGIIIYKNKILFIKRKQEPFKNYYALPGGFVEYNEKTEDAAVREIKEETGVETRIKSLFGIYSKKGRDPRCHTVTIVYELDILSGIFVRDAHGYTRNHRRRFRSKMRGSKEEVENIKLFSLADIPKLAFDHNKIVEEFKKSILCNRKRVGKDFT